MANIQFETSFYYLSAKERNVKESWKEPICHRKREGLLKSSTHGYLVLPNEKFKKLPEENIRKSTNNNRSSCTVNLM